MANELKGLVNTDGTEFLDARTIPTLIPSTDTLSISGNLDVSGNISGITQNNSVYVATIGNDRTGIGTFCAPFLTIQAAIDYAVIEYPSRGYNDPVIITVASGEYREQIHSYENIIIQSAAAAYDPVQGQAKATLINVGNTTGQCFS